MCASKTLWEGGRDREEGGSWLGSNRLAPVKRRPSPAQAKVSHLLTPFWLSSEALFVSKYLSCQLVYSVSLISVVDLESNFWTHCITLSLERGKCLDQEAEQQDQL